MKLYPRAGMTIPDLAKGDALPAEGRDVEMSPYWRRRLRDGDVTDVAPVASSTDSANASSTASSDQDAADSAAVTTTEGA